MAGGLRQVPIEKRRLTHHTRKPAEKGAFLRKAWIFVVVAHYHQMASTLSVGAAKDRVAMTASSFRAESASSALLRSTFDELIVLTPFPGCPA
jgi:hypothetical protein